MTNWLQHPSKYFVTLVIYIILFACLVLFAFGDYLTLAGYVLTILLIIFPQYLYSRSPRVRKNISQNLIDVLQLVIAFASFTNLLGSLYLYKLSPDCQYDLLIHFLNPILIFSMTPIWVIIFQQHFFRHINLAFTLIGNFILVIFGSFLWEFYESLIDSLFTAATMFGQIGEVYLDTLSDLLADFAGGLVASLLVWKYFYRYLLNNTVKQNNHDHRSD